MTTAPVIHLCGWPGCGKLTIARCLQGLIGGRLIDNHLILDPASALFDRSTSDHGALRERVRDVLYEAALGLPSDQPLILTDALASSDADSDLIRKTIALAKRRGARLVPFVLEVDPAENQRRMVDPSRAGRGKLMDPEHLTALRATHDLLRLPGATVIDITDLSADAAARAIAGALEDE